MRYTLSHLFGSVIFYHGITPLQHLLMQLLMFHFGLGFVFFSSTFHFLLYIDELRTVSWTLKFLLNPHEPWILHTILDTVSQIRTSFTCRNLETVLQRDLHSFSGKKKKKREWKGRKQNHIPITIRNTQLKSSRFRQKCNLAIIKDFSWRKHILNIVRTAIRRSSYQSSKTFKCNEDCPVI